MVDLGAAPGGWSQVAAEQIGVEKGQGKIVAIDLLEIEPINGVLFAQMDFNDEDAPERLKEMLGGQADVVLSDMAANTTGHRQTDHLKIVALVEMAAEFAREVLAPGGSFIAKVLQGGTEGELLASLKRDFKVVKHIAAGKPEGFGGALCAGDRIPRLRENAVRGFRRHTGLFFFLHCRASGRIKCGERNNFLLTPAARARCCPLPAAAARSAQCRHRSAAGPARRSKRPNRRRPRRTRSRNR